MRLTVFGSTGRTGQEIVRQALGRGYAVTAYARNPQKIDFTHPHLTVVPGELSDMDAMKVAVLGADCIISALGPAGPVRDTALSDGVGNMLSAMGECDVSRLVLLSTISSPDSNDHGDLRSKLMVGMVKRSYPGNYAEIVRIGQLVSGSNIDWTLTGYLC